MTFFTITPKKNILFGLIIAIALAAADQWSKIAIFALLQEFNPPMIELTSWFNLVTVRNTGVSFGMLQDTPHGKWVLSFLNIAIVTLLLYWLYGSKHAISIWALGMIIGGAFGNLIDRLRFGYVADFIDIHLAGYHWPAFNLADSVVCIGVVLILFEGLFLKEEHL